MQNIVILAGTIRQAPETRTTRSGTDVTRFKLVTSRPRYSEGRVVRDEKGYRVEDAEWHRVVAFNGLGRTIQQYCESGTKVLVRGRIHYTKWQDAEGQDRYGCEIVAETVDFLSRAPQSEPGDEDEDEGRFIDEDDIPS